MDHVIQIRIGVKDGKFYMPVQSEVEYIAIETLGSQGNIYFDSIPLTASLYLKWDGKLRGWEIRHKSGDREEKMIKTLRRRRKDRNRFVAGVMEEEKRLWEENHG